MQIKFAYPYLFCLVLPVVSMAETIDCAEKSLTEAIKSAEGRPVSFTGVCKGPVLIRTDGVQLLGVGTAVIDGGGSNNAITVAGAHGVTLKSIEIRNGIFGVLGSNGAHLTLTDVNVHDNAVFGISLQTASSGVLSGVTTTGNGVHGLDLETGSSATIKGDFASTKNRVFGINDNGSSVTFANAIATLSGNAVGMQVATSANAFINDSQTTLNVNDNLATAYGQKTRTC